MRFTSSKGRGTSSAHAGGSRRTGPAVGIPRFLKTAPRIAPASAERIAVGAPGDRYEREADAVSAHLGAAAPAESGPAHTSPASAAAGGSVARAANSSGRPLDEATRGRMESRFGTDLSHVRTHTGPQAESLSRDLGARAFTQGSDIFYGAGHAPGDDALTAHELTHVVQQGGGSKYANAGPISARFGPAPIQCSFIGSYPVAGNGGFEIDMETREGALATPATASGMDGYIRFVPQSGAPNSNDINMIQIAKVTDAGGADVPIATLPAAQAPRGALGTPGVRTEENPVTGVEGGFFSDVWHQNGAGGAPVAAGTPLSPHFPVQPAGPGVVGPIGSVQQPAIYGGGTGGVVGQTRGFKRSDNPADIRSAALYDTPGVASSAVNWDFSFESVARGEDTLFTYGAVTWGFGVHAGHVVNEHISVQAGQSATFDEAMERHRDFYVHEPVTFYFEFDHADLSAAEIAKIDSFLPYLTRNTDVMLSLEGYADIVGGASDYNRDLSLRRVDAVEAALLAKGIPAARIDSISIGHGASTAATPDAGTGDQGGNAAVGADQSREANRWTNRRVVLTFSHPAAAPGP